MLNTFTEVDYLGAARSRVTEQFKNKQVFDKYIQLLISENVELQKVFKDLMQNRTIDEAVGKQLDIIGDIVGQPRDLFLATLYHFGFDGAVSGLSFGDTNDPSIGGVFRNHYEQPFGTRYLNDDEYRTLIKIKIIKNTTKGSIDDFIKASRLLFNMPDNRELAADITIATNIQGVTSNFTLTASVLTAKDVGNYIHTPDGGLAKIVTQTGNAGTMVILKVFGTTSYSAGDWFVKNILQFTESSGKITITGIGRTYDDNSYSSPPIIIGVAESDLAAAYLPRPLGVALELTPYP